jgi:hypothetical protein
VRGKVTGHDRPGGSSRTPVILRRGVEIEDPVAVMAGFLRAYRIDTGDPPAPGSFAEADLRRANRDGARISAAEIAAVLERRAAIEAALGAIARPAYLAEDLVRDAPFAERAVGLVRGYKRDMDANRAALRAARSQLSRLGYEVTEVRILDGLIWSASVEDKVTPAAE